MSNFQQHNISTSREKSGFTLVEVVVSVTIFAGVITLMMGLFNYTLRIYRQIEAQRQISQSVRNTMEYLVKEIRNGQVDYNITSGLALSSEVDSHCPRPGDISSDTYSNTTGNTNHIGVINVDGERECIYWTHDPDPTKQYDSTNNNIYIKKESVSNPSQLNPPNVKLLDLRFYVSPLHDPYTITPTLAEQEPLVTIVALVSITLSSREVRTVPYQTTVSTYAYDIPSQ